jgi:hypothetical protein
MCPLCVASASVVMGSIVSGGGLTALAVKLLRQKKVEKNNSNVKKILNENEKERSEEQ